MRNEKTEKSAAFEKLEIVFALCERLGVAAATSVSGVAILYFGASEFLPLPVVAGVLGMLVLVVVFASLFSRQACYSPKFASQV